MIKNEIIPYEFKEVTNKIELFKILENINACNRDATVTITDSLGVTITFDFLNASMPSYSLAPYPEVNITCIGPVSIHCPEGVESL
jgi:hypothetical protein